MTVLLVLAGCLAVWFGGCWLAIRRAPFLCDWCGLFIAHGEFEGHEPRCRAAHEPVAGGFLPSPATDDFDVIVSGFYAVEDEASRRTQLTEDSD